MHVVPVWWCLPRLWGDYICTLIMICSFPNEMGLIPYPSRIRARSHCGKQNAKRCVFMTVARQICILEYGVSLSLKGGLKGTETKTGVFEVGGGGGGRERERERERGEREREREREREEREKIHANEKRSQTRAQKCPLFFAKSFWLPAISMGPFINFWIEWVEFFSIEWIEWITMA